MSERVAPMSWWLGGILGPGLFELGLGVFGMMLTSWFVMTLLGLVLLRGCLLRLSRQFGMGLMLRCQCWR